MSASDLLPAITKVPAATTLIAGFGSHHGTDTLGWRVIDTLAERALCGLNLRKYRHPAAVVGELASYRQVFFIDALQSQDHGVGELVQMPARRLKASSGLFSSHSQGLNDAIALAQVLQVLPAHALVVGINVAGFESRALPQIYVDRVVQRLAESVV